MNWRVLVGTAAAATLTLVLAGCGSTNGSSEKDVEAAQVYDEINGLTARERTDRLVELAEAEGELNIYHSNTDLDAVIEAFEKTYDIDVSPTRAQSETVLQRVMTEAESGNFDVDVVENPYKENIIANQQGLFYDYESEYRDAVVDEARMEGWTANYFNVFVVGWNSDEVDASEIPEEIKDFADVRWKGRISLEIGDVDWYAAISTYYLEQGMSEQEVDEMWAAIADNASVEKGHSTMGDMLSAGKLQVALSIYQHTVDGATAETAAPVEWNPDGHHVAPVVVSPTGAGVVTSAPHPAAAMLFMDFMLGEEGQQLMADNFRVGSVPRDDSPVSGVETIPMPLEIATKDFEYWDDKYRDLVGG